MIPDIIEIILLIVVIYLLYTKKDTQQVLKEIKERADKLLPNKTKLIEWQPPKDETEETSKKLLKKIIKK